MPTYGELFAITAEGARREGEQEYGRRVNQGGRQLAQTPDGAGACANPAAAPEAPFPTVTSTRVLIDGGIDLDGQVSAIGGRAAAGTCAHNDFTTVAGARGIDNQFYRVVGCMNGYQPSGAAVEFDTEMHLAFAVERVILGGTKQRCEAQRRRRGECVSAQQRASRRTGPEDAPD
jgi:hypothetical protein